MALSPMMKQYCEIKEQHKDALLLFRVGDFYELYFEDAVTASEELEIYLTGRDCGLEERIPMAGVPFHAVDPYIAKLVEKGYKVAVCEQVAASGERGALFHREVTRIITPGTVIDSPLLDEEKNNYLASVYFDGQSVGISWTDISTGEFYHSYAAAPIATALGELLTKIRPSEIICNEAMLQMSVSLSIVKYGMVCPFSLYNEAAFQYDAALTAVKGQFPPDTVKKLSQQRACVASAGALVLYIQDTQKRQLGHILSTQSVALADCMYLDYGARRSLELTESMQDGGKRGSLLWLIDRTSTKLGARFLRKKLLEPSLDAQQINMQLDGVEELQNDRMRDKLVAVLNGIADIERMVGKLSYGTMPPREMLQLAKSLSAVPQLKTILDDATCAILSDINGRLFDFPEVYDEVIRAIEDKAPQFVREGGVFCQGYDAVLDECRALRDNVETIIKDLESAERAETKLKNLKIDNTRNFGYYIELPRSQSDQVPFRYIRRQTLKNSERYTTEELKRLEERIMTARGDALQREEELYKSLIEKLSTYMEAFLNLAHAIAELDVLVSHAQCAKEHRFVRPQIGEKTDRLLICEGRHPVVEKLLKAEQFVPNDTLLDSSENRTILITGPNMAGKSVYMRQVALIVILAHIGSFVPAKKAEIPIIDKIFTRVGASDDLSTGRSTFMMEMSEVSTILDNLSDSSLVLLDEVGRGTSTYDGLSIAWSILEYLSLHTKAKVLFSTHYHELTDLEGVLDGIKNYKLTLREAGGSIVFLRKLMRGCANRSFGIEVASLAGLPSEILTRAKELLAKLETADIARQAKTAQAQQLSIFNSSAASEIQTILHELDLDNISPRHALDILTDLKEKLDKS